MNYKDIISKAKDFSKSFSSNQLVTMKSVKKLDDNIYLLDYRNDYHIDELLEKGGFFADLVARQRLDTQA